MPVPYEDKGWVAGMSRAQAIGSVAITTQVIGAFRSPSCQTMLGRIWSEDAGTFPIFGKDVPNGPVLSVNYSSSPEGIVLYDAAAAFRAVHPDGSNPYLNFATANVLIDDVPTTVRFVNDPGGMHSEQRLVAWDQAMHDRGTRFKCLASTATPPCGPSSARELCRYSGE